MADYKDYIVRYDIVTNTTNAFSNLRELSETVTKLEEPLNTLKTQLGDLNRVLIDIKAASKIVIEPAIQMGPFNEQLATMKTAVRAAANEMAAMINGSLMGIPQKQLQSNIGKTLNKKELDDMIKSLKAQNKTLNGKIAAQTDETTGLAKHGFNQARENLKAELANNEQLLGILEKQRKQIGSATTTTQAKTPATAAGVPLDAKTADAYRKLLATNKNKLNIQITGSTGGKNGIANVIRSVDTRLKKLQTLGEIPLTPIINEEAFIAAQNKLNSLKQTGVKGKGKQDNKSNTSVPVNAQFSATQIREAIKAIAPPTITANVALKWGKGAQSKQAQLKKFDKIPISLNLDISSAITKLEEFIGIVKSNSPQNIALTATGGANKGAGTTNGHTQRSARQRGTTGHQPLTPTQRAYQSKLRYWKNSWYQAPSYHDLQQAKYDSVFKDLTPEEKRLNKLAEDRSKQATQARLNRRDAIRHNRALQVTTNKSAIDMAMKHWKFFNQASKTTGIIPTAQTPAADMLKYLQNVSSQMQGASVAVPTQLQSEINKLNTQIAKTKGVSPTAVSARRGAYTPVPYKNTYSAFSRWASPTTGLTTFGARAPMAVDMAKGMGVMYAIGGAMSAIGGSFSQAMEYQNTMKTTQAILQNGTDSYSNTSFRNMEATVRDVGIKTKFSAPEVASAAKFIAMAGYNIEEINAAIRPITDLALIGDHELGETADKMTNIMTTFSIKPEQMRAAANIMATTATRSNTDLMMLADSANYGGNMAKMYRESGASEMDAFADTMALFGIMGNSGIQGSSAGTALRMMYLNLFNPNKKQKLIHQQLLNKYKISMYKDAAHTQRRSMADIMIDMAKNIPQNEMADIISKLFRVTSISGAGAILSQAGIDIKDEAAKEQAYKENEVSIKALSGEGVLSKLAELIKANRDSVNGNISGAIAEEKQNTIQGLWAQVTSTFTEGIVRAFEARQGGFEEMLKKLRDYMAKPETVAMLQNLLDLIIEIGKNMAWFAKIWADLYNTMPGMIKFWIVVQMAVSQLRALAGPFTFLIDSLNRLRIAVFGANVATAASTRAATGNAAANIATSALTGGSTVLIPGHKTKFKGHLGRKVSSALVTDTILAAQLASGTGADKADTIRKLNNATHTDYVALRKRYNSIYSYGKITRSIQAGASAGLTGLSFVSLWGSLKFGLITIVSKLAGVLGLLFNPITMAVAALAGFGVAIYQFNKWAKGETDAQIQRRRELNLKADKGILEAQQEGKWHQQLLDPHIIKLKALQESKENKERVAQYDAERQRYNRMNGWLMDDWSKNASHQSVKDMATKMTNVVKSNPLIRIGLGKKAEGFTDENIIPTRPKEDKNPFKDAWMTEAGSNPAIDFDPFDAKLLQSQRAFPFMMANMAATDPKVQEVVKGIYQARDQRDAGKITQKQYAEQVNKLTKDFTQGLPDVITNRTFTSYEDLQGSFDLYQRTTDFQNAAIRIINGVINGEVGTLTGFLDGQKELADAIQNGKEHIDTALDKVIGNYRVYDTFISEDKQKQEEIGVQLSRLKDGTIDFNFIQMQIQEKIGNFRLNLQQFINLISSFYASLSNLGLDKIAELIWADVEHKHIDRSTALQYWSLQMNQNEGEGSKFYNDWLKAGYDSGKFIDFVQEEDYVKDGWFGKKKNTVIIDGKEWFPSQIRHQQIRPFFKNQAVENVKQLRAMAEAANEPNSKDKPNPTGTNPTGTDQKAYASAYNKTAAKPTQIVFNINNLASFDRTMITSDAEEKEIIAAIEERVVSVVYQLFAEAVNTAQNTIS